MQNLFKDGGVISEDASCATFLTGPGGSRTAVASYRDLYERAAGLNEYLKDHGLKSGDRLVLVFGTSAEFFVALIACRIGGFVAVPFPPPSGVNYVERLTRIATDCQAAAILTAASGGKSKTQFAEELAVSSSLCRWIETDQVFHRASPPETPPLACAPDAPFLIQYTSGSTDHPKGVVVTQGAFLHNLHNQHEQMDGGFVGPNVSWLPFHHDMGLFGPVFQTMYWGGHTIFMAPVLFAQRPHLWLDVISRYRAVRSGGPNFAFQHCVNVIKDEQIQDVDLSSWKIAFCGAEPVRSTTMQAFCDRFSRFGFSPSSLMPSYGMAETTLYVSARPVQSGLTVKNFDRKSLQLGCRVRHQDNDGSNVALVSCGQSAKSVDMRIVDPESMREQPDGVVGEIWINGPSVAAGYWSNEAATQATFRARIMGSEALFLRTGDIGFLLDGELFIAGRLKEMIIVRGRNFFPVDIESLLELRFDSLEPAHICAIGYPDAQGEESLSIFAEVRRGRANIINPDELRRAIATFISHEVSVTPSNVHLLRRGSLPKTTSGKIRRALIYDLWREGALSEITRGASPSARDADVVSVDHDFAATQAVGGRDASSAPTFEP